MSLYSENTFHRFWGLSSDFEFPIDVLQEQVNFLFPNLSEPYSIDWTRIADLVLGEEQFGPAHFRIKDIRRLYYQIRPFLPAWIRPLLHKLAGSRQTRSALLAWPIEDRWVRFLFAVMQTVMLNHHKTTLEYVHFWPHGKQFAFVITHDIESASGQSFALRLADLDEKYGFRSSFNFVPQEYRIDSRLVAELKQRGFEIGVHGWKHDGQLFSSKAVFDQQAKQINQFIWEWGAVGFRSPLTHRNPYWMQDLEIEYDSSFFDTDPFEPIPGGTMSIWPFQMGRFVELPYTLVQDHTLMSTLGEKSPRLWLEKVEFIQKYCGMALVNVHPDYQRNLAHLAIYEKFLCEMRQRKDAWHALPRDVARWWKQRTKLDLQTNIHVDLQSKLPCATIGTICLLQGSNDIKIFPHEYIQLGLSSS